MRNLLTAILILAISMYTIGAYAEGNTDYESFDDYVDNYNVNLDNYDVQYNMTNNVGKYFLLEGYAEIDDYYNYGFDDDIEDEYFCLNVEPLNGSYKNRWYIYCNRTSFSNIYEKAVSGKTFFIEMICHIPEANYEKSQGNMAMAEVISFNGNVYISNSSKKNEITIDEEVKDIQMRLYSFGLLDTYGLQIGVLDTKTLEAIASFQQKVNEKFNAGLAIIDPYADEGIIDEATLYYLFDFDF